MADQNELVIEAITQGRKEAAFGVTLIPDHQHSGIDSPTLFSTRYILYRIVQDTTAVTVASTVGGSFVIPFSGTLQDIGATVDTAGTTGSMVIDVNKRGTSILTTKISIETGETTSRTAVTQPVITPYKFTEGDIFTFDVDTIQTTPAMGLTIFINALQL
jgi:hypothetical protein